MEELGLSSWTWPSRRQSGFATVDFEETVGLSFRELCEGVRASLWVPGRVPHLALIGAPGGDPALQDGEHGSLPPGDERVC